MKIAVLQHEVKIGNIEANLAFLEQELAQLSRKKALPDVMVLPELWTTGFYPAPLADYADEDGAVIREFLSRMAKQYRINLVGGTVITKSSAGIQNTCHCFDREGNLKAVYSKTHLFSPMGENEHFVPGKELAVFELDGIRCAAAVCYDIRFPEWIRKLALQDISILFLPAAWPMRRLAHWQCLTRARAIENQIFVVAVNCAGRQPTMKCAGHSAVIDPWGELLAEADEHPLLLQADIDLSIQKEIRQKINVFADRRPELYT